MENAKSLEELAKETRREYFKNWAAKNKDKIKKNSENYWLRKAEQRLKAGGENE